MNAFSLHKNLFISIVVLIMACSVLAQRIPASYSNIDRNSSGTLTLQINDTLAVAKMDRESWLTLENLKGSPKGSEQGLAFDFNNPEFEGLMYYGFVPYDDSQYPQPVFFKRFSSIKAGKAKIKILNAMDGKYDIVGWKKSGKGTLGYRVLDASGRFLYEGRISFKGTGPFEVDDTIIEGPLVNLVSESGATISFTTNHSLIAAVEVKGKIFKEQTASQIHEIKVEGLTADTGYDYTVKYGHNSQKYRLKTAPKTGSRKPFNFAYASDSRAGNGGGERNMHGVNFYMMKKILALTAFRNSAFLQFTGDLVNGYLENKAEIDLQYANWKRAVAPFAHYLPVNVGIGNHESLSYRFKNGKDSYSIDRFPFDSHSTEAVFAANFINPQNGPVSEDGSVYDPDKEETDFPPYNENVYFYEYDNVAMVVLNSNYWYAPSLKHHTLTSGNLHGYIMDNQFKWLKKILGQLQENENIDHIFITEHTPFFPNGGHVGDDMWYNGSNAPRAWIAGKPVKKGIIERRDELLDLIVNKNNKVRAILTGDEHNYCRTEIGPNTEIYPENYTLKKIQLKRTIWQINNGAAGAPYYAQEQTPWSEKVKGFTTQNAVVFFHVDGSNIKVEVQNPDTLEPMDEMDLVW